jgi:uncharacterized protein (DUF2252 family)
MPTTKAAATTEVRAPRPRPRSTRRAAEPSQPLTRDESAALGKAKRSQVPRESHAAFDSSTKRPDPISLIEEQSSRRVPELVPIRYARMMESPFRFYRGAAAIMASDLAGTPQSGLAAQLCGDAHMLNFRLLASPERHLVFDINDFDETAPGPWEWDVKRLATSLVIAGRQNGFAMKDRRAIVTGTVGAYREWMHRFAGMTNLEVWYAQADVDRIQAEFQRLLPKRDRAAFTRETKKARTRNNVQAFDKLTHVVDGERRIVADPPYLTPLSELLPDVGRTALEEQFNEMLQGYSASLQTDRRELLSQYRFVEMARKVVGVGSVGTRCWIILLLGHHDRDPLLLQAKEAEESVLAAHTGMPSRFGNFGERVVAGQRLMQAASDIFLGWQHVDDVDGRPRDFYVRQLRDWKGVAVAEEMRPATMGWFGRLSGATLARAHARSGNRVGIASYLGGNDTFDRAIAEFAEAYADQNERDHRALVDAVQTGRVQAAAIAEPH